MKVTDAIRIYGLQNDTSFQAVCGGPNYLLADAQIFVVVLTGGPCAGKTTTLNKALRQSIAIPNCEVFVAQEAANHLKTGNMNFVSCGCDSTFQRLIIDHQLNSERATIITAIKHKIKNPFDKVICIFDRSLMDGQAYFDDPAEYIKILADYGLDAQKVYERSDMVVYLRSAAIGAEHAYTTNDGTTKRDESVSDAAKLDKNVYEAWKGHPNLVEVDNSFRFNEKLDYAISKIFSVADIPMPVKICRRFIVPTPNDFMLHSNTKHLETFWDKSIFLKQDPMNPDLYKCVRIRTGGKTVTYNYSEQRWAKVTNPKTKRTSEEAVYDTTFQITEGNVLASLLDMDPHINSVEKLVRTFYINDEFYCELSVFECNQKYGYLRVFFDCEEELVEYYVDNIKELFNAIREVTFERKYCEYEIARSNGAVLNDTRN
ncbi:MAG: AAA family ATPase [Clostridia bacterium]|nr:AAA family ATPase [Clostridia bacterium]